MGQNSAVRARGLSSVSAILAAICAAGIAQAQTIYTTLSGPYTDAQAVSAVQSAGIIPQPSSAAPNAPQPTAAAGSLLTYLRGDATTATLCRRTTVTSAADGSFAVTWATPLLSATPWGHVEPIYTGTTMPPVCWMKSISATGIVGQCSPTQTTTLSLSIVTAGLTLNPFGPNTGAAGLTVKVSSCEPTQ